jgi:hypothetical protein
MQKAMNSQASAFTKFSSLCRKYAPHQKAPFGMGKVQDREGALLAASYF